jgi:AcrR family transcriptional regulator
MNNDALDTRGRILQAAIDIVGRKGEVTIREITEGAGVNVASINYYFGNKNNLLKEVENYYSNILYGMQYKILTDEELAPREKLFTWAKNLIEYISRFPSIIRLIVNLSTEEEGYNPLLIQKIYLNREFQNMIEDIISKGTGIEDKISLNYKYLQIFSCILGPVVGSLVASTFSDGEGVFDTSIPQELDKYIDFIVNSALTK